MTPWSSIAGRRWVRPRAILLLLAMGTPAWGQSAAPNLRSRPPGGLVPAWWWSPPNRDGAVRRAQRAVEEAAAPESPAEGIAIQEAPPGGEGPGPVELPDLGVPAAERSMGGGGPTEETLAAENAEAAVDAGAPAADVVSEEGMGPTMPPDLTTPAAARSMGGGGPTTEGLAAENIQQAATPEEHKVKHLQDLLGFDFDEDPVKVYGWVQNSFTGNANGVPRNGQNFGVNPNNQANRWQLNQFYIVVENPIEQGEKANFGFRVDNDFGRDWIFDYNQGMFNDAFSLNSQFAYNMPQLYGEAHFPILTKGGIDVKGGKFYSIVGYEQVPAVSRPLLSVPYMFNYGQPFTHVGVLTTLHLTDRINLYNGSVNGWDRWINQRYLWGYLGGFSWTSKNAKTTFASTVVWGPNQFPDFLPANQQLYLAGYVNIPSLAGLPNAGYARNTRTLFTHVGTHKWSDKLTQVMETDQGWELSIPGLASGGRNGAARTATWFGFGNWFLYEFNPKFSGVWRSEIFWDPQGARLQNMVNGRFVGDRYHEITLGAIWKPRPNIWVRPEARYDWSQFHKAYNDDTRKSQLTLAFDIVLLW